MNANFQFTVYINTNNTSRPTRIAESVAHLVEGFIKTEVNNTYPSVVGVRVGTPEPMGVVEVVVNPIES